MALTIPREKTENRVNNHVEGDNYGKLLLLPSSADECIVLLKKVSRRTTEDPGSWVFALSFSFTISCVQAPQLVATDG